MGIRPSVLLFFAVVLIVSPVGFAEDAISGSGNIQLRGSSARAYDFEEGRYVSADDVSADITLPGTANELAALNGTLLANAGRGDYSRVSRDQFKSVIFKERVDTAVSSRELPKEGAVFLLITGEGTFVKMLLTSCAPGADAALGFTYQTLPGTKADRPQPFARKSATSTVPARTAAGKNK